MASGKTTVGKLLSPMVDLPFLDADGYFEKEMGLSPNIYIRRFGEETFRKHESRLLCQILDKEPSILATGGGVVCQKANRWFLMQSGFVVWLQVPLPMLLVRLQENWDRPLLESPPTFSETERLLKEREPFYRQSHFQIQNAYQNPETIAQKIKEAYQLFP